MQFILSYNTIITNVPVCHIIILHIIGYQKITKDKTSDADLANEEVAFQPQTWTSRPLSDVEVAFQLQMQRSRSNLRSGPRVLCQTRRSRSNLRHGGRQTRTSRPLSNAEVAFQFQPRRSQDVDLASFLYQTRRSRFNSNASLSRSAFQHRREHVSYASQHQSKVRIQRETRISAVTDSHEFGQLHPHFLST